MINFKEFICENASKGLSIFDIDDTLFKSDARVLVLKNGKVIKKLTPDQFNGYRLMGGESFDFQQFKSSKVFMQTARPIDRMIETAKAIIRRATAKGSKVIIVTARSNMDDRDTFLRTFRMHGIDIDKVRIERSGNLRGSTSENKREIFKKYLDSGEFTRVRLFDDDINNCKALLSLKNEYPHIDFTALLVDKNGRVKKV
ncbi:MAG: hypothetical protein N0C84_00430 [Candidatus Thiodiazotropha taylori]|uniref:Uncharacterized protein n=1 Tax=Candidatus Thiodiazotropha taylori TaxID=2792791 RepID=A0A9E4KA36_9GAMM|nr:hypothetical protein [Candidatus Thiodiazotropha taylori]MCW4254910.1 hypothetical protein [Candidatus Thiodiazotropha taylori]